MARIVLSGVQGGGPAPGGIAARGRGGGREYWTLLECDGLYLWICLDRQLYYTLIKYMSSTKLHFNKLYVVNNSCV